MHIHILYIGKGWTEIEREGGKERGRGKDVTPSNCISIMYTYICMCIYVYMDMYIYKLYLNIQYDICMYREI